MYIAFVDKLLKFRSPWRCIKYNLVGNIILISPENIYKQFNIVLGIF